MSTKFFALNQIESAVITSSTENLLFPLTNLKDPRRTKVFRTTASSGWVVFDFGEAISIDSFLIADNNMSGFNINSLTFMLNNSNAWGSPAYSSAIALDYEFGFAWHQLPAPLMMRYARIEFTSVEAFCEITKMFIGAISEIITDVTYPIEYNQNSLAKITKNRYGQRFIDEISSQKKISVTFAFLEKDEMDAVFEVVEYCSNSKPLWLVFDSLEITNNNNRINGYYYLMDDPKMTYVAGNFWNLGLDLEEGT